MSDAALNGETATESEAVEAVDRAVEEDVLTVVAVWLEDDVEDGVVVVEGSHIA